MKRKGGTARDRLKEAWSEIATRRTETGYEAALVGRAGRKSRSPYPSKARSIKGQNCKSGGCARKAAGLTPGDLHRVLRERKPQGSLTAAQKSAKGVVGRFGG